MSLQKQYQLRCDVADLQRAQILSVASDNDDYRARLEATQQDRMAARRGCEMASVLEYSGQMARRTAKAQNWKRVTSERPIYAGADTTTKVAYDLCVHCAPLAEL